MGPCDRHRLLRLRLEHFQCRAFSGHPTWGRDVCLPVPPDVNFDHLARELSDVSTV